MITINKWHSIWILFLLFFSYLNTTNLHSWLNTTNNRPLINMWFHRRFHSCAWISHNLIQSQTSGSQSWTLHTSSPLPTFTGISKTNIDRHGIQINAVLLTVISLTWFEHDFRYIGHHQSISHKISSKCVSLIHFYRYCCPPVTLPCMQCILCHQINTLFSQHRLNHALIVKHRFTVSLDNSIIITDIK